MVTKNLVFAWVGHEGIWYLYMYGSVISSFSICLGHLKPYFILKYQCLVVNNIYYFNLISLQLHSGGQLFSNFMV